jgi:BioD-like phosphotransacetylase family protein
MATLYLISLEPESGKTAMCVGIGLEFQATGLKVGYFKPVGRIATDVEGHLVDRDCAFVPVLFGMTESVDETCPVLMTPDLLEKPLDGKSTDMQQTVLRAFEAIAQKYQLVIMEGGAGLADGWALGLSPVHLAPATKSQVVVVMRYRPGVAVDRLLLAKSMLGDRLVGVIVSDVPRDAMSFIRDRVAPFLEAHQMRLVGAMPQDQLLTAITVRELADVLGGRIISAPDRASELVESFSVGAMNVEGALRHFMRLRNKAVITGGDRSDIQLAALQTSTKCLILTGNLYPDSIILGRATELGVPVIVVPGDTLSTVNTVERNVGRIRLSSPRQIDRLRELVKGHLDLAWLRSVLGV